MGGTGSGRKPTPTRLHVLRGNPGKRALPKHEPQFEAAGIEEPPAWLCDAARAEWRRLAPSLVVQGVLTAADRAAFVAYCEAFAQVEEASKRLKAEGYTVASKEGGPRANPMVRIRNQALDQLHRWAAVFGLTPSARSKIVVATEPNDELARWRASGPAR